MTDTEEYAWVRDVPTIREWIGPREIQMIAAAKYVLSNRDYEGTMGVDRNAFEDNKLYQYVKPVARAKGVRVKFLPPYSPDLSPIEPAWALVKQQIKAVAPRSQDALHRVAHRARLRVTPSHCNGWFRHCGFRGSLK